MEEAEGMIAKRENAANERKRSTMPIFKVKKRRKDPPTVTGVTQLKADASIQPAENSRSKSQNDDNPGSDADVGGSGALGGLLGYGSDFD